MDEGTIRYPTYYLEACKHPLPRFRGDLVGQQEIRIVDQGNRERSPLGLAAGQVNGQFDVFRCGEERDQIVTLEHDPDLLRPQRGALLFAQGDGFSSFSRDRLVQALLPTRPTFSTSATQESVSNF
ncbi:MAG: hypothetical protein JJE13_12920 [Thermoleophilia bacterium]|nr:hypothetical protein [Thermoleophilia bacterium]